MEPIITIINNSEVGTLLLGMGSTACSANSINGYSDLSGNIYTHAPPKNPNGLVLYSGLGTGTLKVDPCVTNLYLAPVAQGDYNGGSISFKNGLPTGFTPSNTYVITITYTNAGATIKFDAPSLN